MFLFVKEMIILSNKESGLKGKLILSLCLAPYALCLKPLLPAKTLNSDPRKAGSWIGPKDQVLDVE
jgi:hypothetical protein